MSNDVSNEEIIEELNRVANLLGKKQVPRMEFNRHSKITSGLIERRFGSWNKAIEATGLVPGIKASKLSDSVLKNEFSRVQKELGKIPTRIEFGIHGKHSPTIYENRFGSWHRAIEHYTGEKTSTPRKRTITRQSHHRSIVPLKKASGRTFGSPLDFRGLRHEPTNEQGIVFLFGMVARELGFLVEAVAQGYPDCVAKRQVKGSSGQYESVNIEFEFKSSRFNHDPDKCDLIICWEHDWPACPIEVIELKSVIKDLQPNA